MAASCPARARSRCTWRCFPTAAELDALADPALVERWNTLVALREQVLAQIEPLRKTKQIGSSLQAKVVVSATAKELPLLEQYAKHLPMLFIVSEVEIRPAPDRRSTRDDEALAQAASTESRSSAPPE